jgi:hypothetical protein
MASEGKITKDDISVKDPFSYLTESAKIAQAHVDSLAKDLDLILPKTQAILGGKSNTVSDIQAQTKAMDVLIARQKQARQAQENLTKSEQALAKARVEQIRLEQAREKSIDRHNQQLERNIKIEQRLQREQEKLNSSYNKVQAGLTSLSDRYRDLAIKKEMGETLSAKEEIRLARLQSLTLKYDAALKSVDVSMGRHQRKVGDYASGWNGLGNAVNQITRESSAFVYSMQTGFLAISNNLPILFDELGRIKKQNADIIAQGGKTVSVWRQVGLAIFSLNTLLTVGVTLLTFYGAKLVENISAMFNFTKAINALVESKKQINESSKQGVINAQQEIIQLKVNLGVAKDVSKSYEERLIAVDKLQKEYPSFLGNLSKEAILAGQTRDAENELTSAILQRAKAAAAIGKITENQSKVIDLEEKLRLIKYKVAFQEALLKKAEIRAMNESKTSTRENTSALDRYNHAQNELNSSKREQIEIENQLNSTKIINNRLTQYAIDNTRFLEFAKDVTDFGNTIDKSTNKSSEVQETRNKGIEEYLKLKQKELDLLNNYTTVGEEDGSEISTARTKVLQAELIKLMADETQIEQKQANEDLIKAKKELLQLEFKIASVGKTNIEIAELEAKLDLDIYNLKQKQVEVTEKQVEVTDEAVKKSKQYKETIKEIAEATEELAKIATEYYQNKLQAEINGLNNSLELVSRQMSVIEQKSALGNSRAEESLKKQILLQEELNKRKLEAENKMAKLNLINSIVGTAGSIIQGFETGTEYEVGNYIKPNLSGVGIDNTLIRVHGKERIVNEDLSKQIVGRKTSDVVKNALAYEQMIRYPMNQTIDMSETNELLRKVANKPDVEYNLGEITQTTFELIRKEIKGNTETNHIYKNKYKV